MSCLAWLAAIFGEVVDLPAIVVQVSDRCRMRWWPDCYLLQLQLVLLAAALELLQW
jgi:hypothetical protein